MKKNLTALFCIMIVVQITQAQNVGIGTTNPSARLHVADSSVVFSASSVLSATPGNPPVSGGGRRMMWYADKAAFRAGYVTSTNWDKDNTGPYSVAFGYNNKALGASSSAMGVETTASGFISTTMGYNTAASSNYSTAMGFQTTASGGYSIAMGSNTTASGESSTAMGSNTTASGYYSTAMGYGTHASGYYSTAMGYYGQANSDLSFAIGEYVTANSSNSISLGSYNDPVVSSPTLGWVLTEPLLILGNGTGPSDKRNALVILKNGNIGINTSTPTAPLTFSQDLQKKIILFTGPLGDAGFSTSPGQIRIHTDDPNTNITFGYDNRTTGFTENLRSIGTNGDLVVRNRVFTTGVIVTSDSRYKKNIQPINNALQRITQLQGYNYYWKDKEQDTSLQSGVLAQEVEKIFPELVHADDKGFLSVNYIGLIPYLIESTKEQQDEIKKEKTEIRQQHEQINQLTKENEELKKMKMEVEELKKIVKKL